MIPNFNNPSAAVSGLLGNLLKQPVVNQNTSQRERSRSVNPLQEIQGLFGGKKQ